MANAFKGSTETQAALTRRLAAHSLAKRLAPGAFFLVASGALAYNEYR